MAASRPIVGVLWLDRRWVCVGCGGDFPLPFGGQFARGQARRALLASRRREEEAEQSRQEEEATARAAAEAVEKEAEETRRQSELEVVSVVAEDVRLVEPPSLPPPLSTRSIRATFDVSFSFRDFGVQVSVEAQAVVSQPVATPASSKSPLAACSQSCDIRSAPVSGV